MLLSIKKKSKKKIQKGAFLAVEEKKWKKSSPVAEKGGKFKKKLKRGLWGPIFYKGVGGFFEP